MQVHATDPAYAASADSRERFRAAAALAVMFVAALALVHFASWALGLDLQRFGVRPRDVMGLAGIVTAPLLHGDLAHLAANALPLLLAGTMLLYLYPDSSRIVLPVVYLGPGLLVWLFGRDSVHIGASGLVYGIVAYVFLAGILRRDRRAWAASVLVAFFYGALVWGVLPMKLGVSWETHLAAAAIGIVLAFALRHRDVPPRKLYSWEMEEAREEAREEASEGAGDDEDWSEWRDEHQAFPGDAAPAEAVETRPAEPAISVSGSPPAVR
ncbi:MAG: rhomboid family intramembrane serine protease [Burkholderiales bacterium]